MLKNILKMFGDDNDGNPTYEQLDNKLRALELIATEQKSILIEKKRQVEQLEHKLSEIEKNGGYGYRAQHFEWLNKETLRLSHLVREYAENNEKLNAENLELTEKLKQAKSRKKNNE